MPQRQRLSLAPRPRRNRRVPAYQLSRGHRPGTDQSSALELAGPDAGESLADEPLVDAIGAQSAGPDSKADTDRDTAAFPVPGPTTEDTFSNADTDADSAATATIVADISDVESVTDPVDQPIDYAAYAASLEAAAAQSRAAVQPEATVATTMRAGPPPATRVRRRRIIGHRAPAGSGAGGSGGPPVRPVAGEYQPDPRPVWKRPKTWLVGVGAIAAIAAIVGVLWSLNLLRVTYQAYNAAHVDTPERIRYRVNAQGTPEAIPTEEVEAALPNWQEKDPFNILLMGVDTRPNDIEPPRSDTMIVVHIDPLSKQVSMMGLPRDLYVQIPGFGSDKINAAYPLGEVNKDDTEIDGPSLAAQTIEANLNIDIDYFVTVDFNGFQNIIDTIGGVVIDVPAPVKDDMYPAEGVGLTRQYFPAGLQKMDGETALRYSRTRNNDNDIERGERQQQMLVAIREQALSLDLITRADDLLRDAGDTVQTDLNFNQMLALANLGREIKSDDITRINLWEAGVLSEHLPDDNDAAYYLEPDRQAMLDLVEQYFSRHRTSSTPAAPAVETGNTGATETLDEGVSSSGSQPPPVVAVEPDGDAPIQEVIQDQVDFSIPVIVQNDSTIDLAASSVAALLQDAGFAGAYPENGADVLDTTVIYDYAGSPATARYIARYLGLAESSIVYSGGGNGIVVAVGRDLGIAVGE